jgi:anti-sigma B factor antagonist
VAIDVKTERRDAVLSMWVGGRLDGSNAEEFEADVKGAIAAGDRALVMDLADLAYVSSAGLRAILLTAKTLWDQEAEFVICSVPRSILEILEMSGFDKLLTIQPDRDEALAALGL